MSSFTLEILTPDKPFFKGNVGSVVVKGSEGFLGILAQHAPLLVRLTPGPLRIKQDDAEHVFIAGAGLAEVTATGVTILVDSAKVADGADADKTV